MLPKTKKTIEDILTEFTTVRWDRFVEGEVSIAIYGWIERTGETFKAHKNAGTPLIRKNYKDFILLRYFPFEDGWEYTTSSPEIHSEINRIFHPGDATPPNNPCKRVESHFDIPNSIKLTTI